MITNARPYGCKCKTFSEHLTGDGCDECNKALVIELLTDERNELNNEVARLRGENAELKQGKVFVDPKWIYALETQLAKAHEELCQAGIREYGN